MKNYTKPQIDINIFDIENIINVSSVALTYGGSEGRADDDTYSSLFGE